MHLFRVAGNIVGRGLQEIALLVTAGLVNLGLRKGPCETRVERCDITDEEWNLFLERTDQLRRPHLRILLLGGNKLETKVQERLELVIQAYLPKTLIGTTSTYLLSDTNLGLVDETWSAAVARVRTLPIEQWKPIDQLPSKYSDHPRPRCRRFRVFRGADSQVAAVACGYLEKLIAQQGDALTDLDTLYVVELYLNRVKKQPGYFNLRLCALDEGERNKILQTITAGLQGNSTNVLMNV
jgi:hypothetical protein